MDAPRAKPASDGPRDDPRRLFRARDRLSLDRDYRAVFAAKCRKHAGPLTVFTKPNGLGRHRLGLSIGRRVGVAVVRSRLKRRLREAFRLHRQDWPGSYDIVVSAREHEPLKADRYAQVLADAVRQSHETWRRRGRRDERRQSEGANS